MLDITNSQLWIEGRQADGDYVYQNASVRVYLYGGY